MGVDYTAWLFYGTKVGSNVSDLYDYMKDYPLLEEVSIGFGTYSGDPDEKFIAYKRLCYRAEFNPVKLENFVSKPTPEETNQMKEFIKMIGKEHRLDLGIVKFDWFMGVEMW